MKVLKFGGSSVADATRISLVLDIVSKALETDRVILVCSAISGCTDALLEIGKEEDKVLKAARTEALKDRHMKIVKRLFTGSERSEVGEGLQALFNELAAVPGQECVSFGELFSTYIIARKFFFEEVPVEWIDSRKLILTRDGAVDEKTTYANIKAVVDGSPAVKLFVAPGFIASKEDGSVTTLGRGGSDYSAAIYAAGSKASALEIWTDVPGIMTANPKVVPGAVTIPDISYKAALSLAANGAKVLYPLTVKPAMEAGIAFSIKNTFDPSLPGTIVSGRLAEGRGAWMGVTSQKAGDSGDVAVCLVGESIPDREAACRRILSALADAGVQPLGGVEGEGDEFFIRVRPTIEQAAVAAIHREFFEVRSVTTIPVFVAGFGAVGSELVRLLGQNKDRIAERSGHAIRLAGLANSKRFAIDLAGIEPVKAASVLESGDSASGGAFVDAVIACAPRGAVFVDCTDDHNLHTRYKDLFRRGINIVTSNRRSLALPYVQYASLKREARQNGVFFRYDTTVGNSLPILESIASDANCSDGIESIEAVVSCTLNYIITGHGGAQGKTLAQLLRCAQSEGLTEPDPRTDLGGRDVLRKLLILSREAGVALEEEDVEISPLLGPEFFDCPLEEFYSRLEEYEPLFAQKEKALAAAGKCQRFVASLRKDPSSGLGFKAQIKMQDFTPESPFFWINGTENVIVVSSEYSAPLVIKGAGEGVRLAATGIIKNILM